MFLTDSNLHKMNVDMMNHVTVAPKIFCPQIRDIEYIIENNAIKRKPSQIYIQCGTNDVGRPSYNVDETSMRIDNIISALIDQVLDEEGEIIISSSLPRYHDVTA